MHPFSLCYSDDDEKITFNNSGNNVHDLKNVTCVETLWGQRDFLSHCL